MTKMLLPYFVSCKQGRFTLFPTILIQSLPLRNNTDFDFLPLNSFPMCVYIRSSTFPTTYQKQNEFSNLSY